MLPNISTTTGLDGTFSLHELPDKGKFTLVITYMSYKTKEIVVDVAKDYSKGAKDGKDGQLTIAMEATEKYGALKGGVLALRRICCCHPFYHGRRGIYDPVP